MNPNSFKSSEEFNVDDEIAKLWASLGEEMKKMNSTTPSNQNAPQLVTKKSPEASRFNPITIDQNAPKAIRRNGPEIPNFSAVSPKKAENTSRENSHGMKLPPTIGSSSSNGESSKGPEVPHFSREKSLGSDEIKTSYDIPQIFNSQDSGPSVPRVPKKESVATNIRNDFLPAPEIPRKPAERRAEPFEEIGKAMSAERKRIANKTAEALRSTQKLRKKISGIVGENTDRIKKSSAERFENARNNLDEKYKIFEQNIRDNKDNLLDVGKKSVAILLSVLTIGGSAAAVAYQKRSEHATSAMTTAGEEYKKIHDQEIEEARGGKAEIREYVDEETGKRQVEILLDDTNKPDEEIIKARTEENDDIKETTIQSTGGMTEKSEKPTVIPKEETTTLTNTETATDEVSDIEEETSTDVVTETMARTQEQTKEADSHFSKENISSKEAYEKISNILESGEYLNIEADCTADYFVELCKKVNFSTNQTAAMLANAGHESQWCALLKQVGGAGFGFFQFDGANMYGYIGQDYYGDGNRMTYDGFQERMRKIDPKVYDYCFKNNPFKGVGYEVDDEMVENILDKTGTRDLYCRTLVRQLQYLYYVTQEDNWENNQMNKVKNCSSAYDCTWNFAKFVERPQNQSDSAMGRRASTGSKIAKLLQQGISLLGSNPKM